MQGDGTVTYLYIGACQCQILAKFWNALSDYLAQGVPFHHDRGWVVIKLGLNAVYEQIRCSCEWILYGIRMLYDMGRKLLRRMANQYFLALVACLTINFALKPAC